MNNSLRWAAALLVVCCFNLVHAQDACKKRWDEASKEMDEARQAFDFKNWQYSSMLYQRAASRWEDAAYSCSGKNKENAQESVRRARSLSETAQSNLEMDNCKYLTDPASEAFDSAKQASQSQDFARARDLYLRASEQYQRAASTCNGPVVDMASRNATAAANNANTARLNMDIHTGNNKMLSCRQELDTAFEAVKEGSQAADEKQFRAASQKYGKAETVFAKLAKTCQSQINDDLTLKTSQAKMLKENYASMGKKKP